MPSRLISFNISYFVLSIISFSLSIIISSFFNLNFKLLSYFYGNHQIFKYTPHGKLLWSFPTQYNVILSVTKSGEVYAYVSISIKTNPENITGKAHECKNTANYSCIFVFCLYYIVKNQEKVKFWMVYASWRL